MRILHAYKVYLPDSFGGVPSAIAMLAKLSEMGFDNRILVARDRGWMRSYNVNGVPVTAVTSVGTFLSMPLALTYPFRLALSARTFDLVVHHAPFPLTDMGILFLPRKCALAVHWHAEVTERPLLMRLLTPLIRHALKRADCIVVSDQTLIENSPFLRDFAEKCIVVPFGCDVDYWAHLSPQQHDAVAALRQSSPRLIVAIGRLVRYKGFDVLLRAMQHVDAELAILGEGPLRAELEDLARQLNISHRVRILPHLETDGVKQYIHAAKALAVPSITEAETFGMVQIEAMSAGRPVVNTHLPTAVPSIARDGKEGLTVPPADPDALAAALRRLLDDPPYAAKLAAAGQARAYADYNQASFLGRMKQVYNDAVRNHVTR